MKRLVTSSAPDQSPGRLANLIQQRDGKMTRELLLQPGKHGLGMTHGSMEADATTVATCGFCATGCGLRLHLREGEAVGLTPETDYPVNLGMACPKGWEALRVLDADDRATVPLRRGPDGERTPISWDDALEEFCSQFKSIQSKHGNESVAFLSTGQIPCEEMAFLGALAKFGMGIRHGDGNTRQCMATAVTAYKESFGFDAPPYSYQDFEESDCLVFVGANPCIGHPIMWERVLRNKNQPEIIVVDPRRTETAMAATQHLQISPKSDLAFLYSVTHQLIADGCIDKEFIREHTVGFDQLRDHVEQFQPSKVADYCGVSPAQIRSVAETIGKSKAVSLWWTMGVNQSHEGTRTAQAIINLALITGNIGRPGTGANSITGQCNAMGSRLWSNTTNLLGHRRFECDQDRKAVAETIGVNAESIPRQSSWSYDQIIDGVRRGEIRGLWVIATNPAHSWIEQNDLRQVLDQLDFLVVQDMYHSTETARYADLLLPAAGWGEKEGTFINSERRYGLLKKVRRAPGQALADFHIFRGIAERLGVSEMFTEWQDPESVFRILQRLSEGRPCDISGIDGYAHLDRCGGIQWPYTSTDCRSEDGESASPNPNRMVLTQQRRLFQDGKFFHADGRARLVVDQSNPPSEQTNDEFPFVLLTGRGTVSQWHTQTRTGKSPVLASLYPGQPYLEIHPDDAHSLGITNGDPVEIVSRQGQATAIAMVSPTVRPGHTFMPMHYEATNKLTRRSFDPHSRQPSYKYCAVRLSVPNNS